MNSSGGSGYSGIVFENITITGTGAEYPNNGGAVANRGFMVNLIGASASQCGMSYSGRGGSATVDISGSGWNAAGSCPGGCLPLVTGTSSTTITSATTFGVCDSPILLTATSTPPSGKTVSSVQFYVDGVSKGTDNSSPYSVSWSSPSIGTHSVYAVSTYSDGTTSTSPTQTVTVTDEIYSTGTAPIIDGIIDPLWNNYASFPLNAVKAGAANISGPLDLSATFKVTRDATYLYVLINVTDDILRNDGPANWQKDDVELYIDYGNTKLGCCAYGANDEAYNFVWNVNTVYVGPGSSTGVTFAQTTKAAPSGYIMEIRLPWTTLGGPAPAPGAFLGFEVEVNDSDVGPDRDSKIAWTPAATDDAWENPSQFGTLQIAGCINPLPVELMTFTGERKNGTAVLSWVTATEVNNQKFIIERSGDLSDWQIIGEVAGAGNSVSINNYSFTDYTPLAGKVYYRLRQVDINGTFAYSNVVAVQIAGHSISITPNPFDDALTIITKVSGNMDVSIRDVLGRLLYHDNQETNNGMLSISPDLSSGIYLITIQTEAFIEQQKVIKK
jgi:hypothetical protein